jgi:hypothetical protein
MTGHQLCAGCALTTLLIGASWEAEASGTIGNPELKVLWERATPPPPVTVVSAAVLSCGYNVSPRRVATDVSLVDDAIIGPLPQGDWCDLRLVVDGDNGARQILLIDIEGLQDSAEAVLWLDGAAVGQLSAEAEALAN